MHLPVLDHNYLGMALPSLHSSALNFADVPFCQVKQAQNSVKKFLVVPVQFISLYKEKYSECFVFLCFPAVTQQNNSPKQVPGMTLFLQLPTGFCTSSCFERRQQDPSSHGISGKDGMFTWITACSAISSSGGHSPALKSDIRADATELPNFPKFLQLLGPNKWCDKPIPVTWPTRGHWSCPGAQSSDVPASTEGWRRALLAAQCLWCFPLYCSTAEALQPQSFPAHKACSGCCRTLSSVFSVQQEGRLHGAVHVTAVSALLMGGEHLLVCGTNIQIYFPLAENQCIIHRDSLV